MSDSKRKINISKRNKTHIIRPYSLQQPHQIPRILRGLKIFKIWLCVVPLRSKIEIEQLESERVFSRASKNDYEEK